MSLYKKIGQLLKDKPELVRPHVKAPDISHLNFQKMKDMGMEKIIFVKENVIIPYDIRGYVSYSVERVFQSAFEIFDFDNIGVITKDC